MVGAALKILCYLAAAAFSVIAFKAQKRRHERAGFGAYVDTLKSCLHAIRTRRFSAPPQAWRAFGWLSCAAICAGLAFLRAIDLDTIMRTIAASDPGGWYETRRSVQPVVIVGLGTIGVGGAVLAGILARRTRPLAVALVVAIVLVLYVAVRAVSYHAFDRFIGQSFLGVHVNSWIEISGILAIVLSAYMSGVAVRSRAP